MLECPGSKPPRIGYGQPLSVVELLDPEDPAAREALELYRVSFSSPAEPPYTQIDQLMHKGFYRLLVMFNEEGSVIACAYIIELPNNDVYHLDYFCVKPGSRGGGIGSKFFNGTVDFLKRERRYSYFTLESETQLVGYYHKLHCTDPHVQSDTFGDHTYYLLYMPLDDVTTATDDVRTRFEAELDKVVADIKGTLHLAAMFTQLEVADGAGIDMCGLLPVM